MKVKRMKFLYHIRMEGIIMQDEEKRMKLIISRRMKEKRMKFVYHMRMELSWRMRKKG
jgi:hypothetical protein